MEQGGPMARVTRPDAIAWRPNAGEIPIGPGVYRFHDSRGRVLYVGKAINLRQRLSNYFQPTRNLHERTRAMVGTASGVEWTVVTNDREALELEYTWIKQFAPPFNVKFRDDKTYPHMVVTLADEAPRVMVTRNRRIPGGRYFGPYPKIWAVRETIEQMVQAFPIRTCSDSSYKRAMQSGRPCFPGQIGRCGGPCSFTVSVEEHRAIVDQFVAFMAHPDPSFIAGLQREMRAAAAAFEYERAAKLRDRIQSLQNVLARSAVVLKDDVDTDVFGIEHDELAAAVQQFMVRGGRVTGTRNWVVDTELDVTLGDLVDAVLQSAYEPGTYDTLEPPREIVVPALPDDAAALESWLSERRANGTVSLKAAVRGDRAAILQTAAMNAKQSLALHKMRRGGDYVARTQALTDIQGALGLEEAPLRIECYDVSHLGGTNIVASMVVFEDGLPQKSSYRKFAIKEYADDLESISQVLRRRLTRLSEDELADPMAPRKKRFAYRPGLVLVDGGEPQVNAAAAVFEELGIGDIPVAGIAKRLEEIWLPGESFPVILPRNSEALFLIQRIRDEAHRFAITFQRQKRKNDIASILAEISGLGPARVKVLLAHFGSVTRLKKAGVAEISKVPGVGPSLAAAIVARLGGDTEGQ
jgi:excinuclease ABC subunit C